MLQELQHNTLLKGGLYRIDRMLGYGAFGITYLAVNTMTYQNVAIKEFYMNSENSRESSGTVTGMTVGSIAYNYSQKFRKEIRNLSQLKHGNIVQIIDFFDDNGTSYYVMDYVEGQNLREYGKCHTLSIDEIKHIITEVGQALIYMHEEKHMLHRDLKPNNIMRREGDGHIFLIDFGLSKHFDANGTPESSTSVGQGTPGYAPIEQANEAKEGEFRPTIDVYALGATMLALITGKQPPHATEFLNDSQLLPSIIRTCNVDKSLSLTITKAMMPIVNQRTPSVRAMIGMMNNFGDVDNDETIINDDETTEYIGNENAASRNFTYPLTIPVNKTIYTDCQLWVVENIELTKKCTRVHMTLQSLDRPTTAWSGNGKIRTDEGVILRQTGTTLPKTFTEDFVINAWQTIDVTDEYPPLSQDVTGFSLLNDTIIIKSIAIMNGQTMVPDANIEEFQETTKEDYLRKKNGGQSRTNRNTSSTSEKSSEFSFTGMIYIIGIIIFIVIIIKILIS